VDIPAGVEDGITLQLRGEGDAGERGAPHGDLYILLRVDAHEFFQRSQYDILLDMEITFPQAALGIDITVPTLEAETTLHIPPGTQPNTVFRLKGQGVPHLQNTSRRGDEVIRVKVATPKELTKRQRDLLEELSQTFAANSTDGADGSTGWFRGRKGSKS
jgi:molecular chaperone DnaJ